MLLRIHSKCYRSTSLENFDISYIFSKKYKKGGGDLLPSLIKLKTIPYE